MYDTPSAESLIAFPPDSKTFDDESPIARMMCSSPFPAPSKVSFIALPRDDIILSPASPAFSNAEPSPRPIPSMMDVLPEDLPYSLTISSMTCSDLAIICNKLG